MRVAARLLLVCMVAAGAVGTTVLSVAPAGACNCLGSGDAGALQGADVAFIGVALPVPPEIQYPHATHADGSPDFLADRTLRFRVERVFKGDVAAEQELVTPGQGPACGIAVDVGKRYLMFGAAPVAGEVWLVTPEPGQYAAYLCSGTREARLDERPAGFPQGTSIVRAAPDPQAPAPILPEGSDSEWYVLPVLMTALVVAIAAVVLVTLRRTRR